MSKSSEKREKIQEEAVAKNVNYPCPVCGRLSVVEGPCAEHKSEE